MYTVEIKTNQPWPVRRKLLAANRWTTVLNSGSLLEAEKDLAWIINDFDNADQVLRNFKAEFRIKNKGSIVWKQERSY